MMPYSLLQQLALIFYIPCRTDMAGHTKAFVYQVIGKWGASQAGQFLCKAQVNQ